MTVYKIRYNLEFSINDSSYDTEDLISSNSIENVIVKLKQIKKDCKIVIYSIENLGDLLTGE